MAATTTLLGLVTPTQGTLTGTWGDTVNYGISDYLDIAIAGTLSFAGDGAITLANTTGSSSGNSIGATTAQYAIIRVTGTLTTAKIITGPSYSKTYLVVNAATGSTVTFKASGQTGVSIAVGETALVYYNGTDYVKVVGTATAGAAGGSTTQVQYNNSGVLAGITGATTNGTALTLVAPVLGTPASGTVTNLTGTANININGTVGATTANTGAFTTVTATPSGATNPVEIRGLSNFPTYGAISFNSAYASTTILGLYAGATGDTNLHLNAPTTKSIFHEVAGATVTTTSSTGLAVTGTLSATTEITAAFGTAVPLLMGRGTALTTGAGANDSAIRFDGVSGNLLFSANATERLRLSSTGTLSGGTSGTGYSFSGSAPATSLTLDSSGNLTVPAKIYTSQVNGDGTNDFALLSNNASKDIVFYTGVGGVSAVERARIDSAGNLGLGVTPSAWDTLTAFQIKNGSVYGYSTGDVSIGVNNYYGTSNFRYITSSVAAGKYTITGNEHYWYQAPSGTAGNAISFTQAMTLDASGRLGIGTTSPAKKLSITGTGDNDTSCSILTTNTNAGTGVQTGLFAANGTQQAQITLAGTGYTTYGAYAPGNFVVYNDQAVVLLADNASTGIIKFATGGNTERARIDSSGNLLVGSTNANAKLYVENSTQSKTASFWDTNASSTSEGICTVLASRDTTNNTFYAASYYNAGAGAYRYRMADSGAIATAGSISIGTATPATSGIGVQFPATQSASSDANTLDDYEEGTWTPTCNAGATLTLSGSPQYVKIGKQVTIHAEFSVSVNASGTQFQISGLPFASNSSTGNSTGVVMGYFATDLAAYLPSNASTITFQNQAASANKTNIELSGKYLIIACTYFSAT